MKNKKIINSYEKLCCLSNIDIITSGRYLFSGFNYIDYLARDITDKLELKKDDRLIDIGCNIGIYHKQLKDKISYILGVDAGQEIIKKAKEKNRYSNVDYMCLDILEGNWDKVNKKFNKALVYSVIHFFDGIDDIKRLLTSLLKILEDDFIILLGEVRDEELYINFNKNRNNRRHLLRTVRFFSNKFFNSLYLRNSPPGISPTLFNPEEIFSVCNDLGIKVRLIKQENKHPFYNTCVDYILRKK